MNFYGAGVGLAQVAKRQLFEDRVDLRRPFRSDQIEFIRSRSHTQDGPLVDRYWEAPQRFSDEYFEVEDAWMLGHTGVLAHPGSQAIVTGWGEAENRNRDKAALLRATDPVEAVTLPVRRYTSYFHVFFDVALPMVAYFESDARIDAPHVILHMRAQAPFVRVILEAIAGAYGAELREIDKREKTLCRRVVHFRRTRPAADWYPARPEIASRLREILLAHLCRAPEPSHPGVYLERGVGKLRNLSNADEVRRVAEAAGLRPFRPAPHNFADQIAECAGARTIFAVHGAALTNILFAEPGARIVELFGRNFTKSVYLALAHMLGHSHTAVIAGEDDPLQNFEADATAIKAALDAGEAVAA